MHIWGLINDVLFWTLVAVLIWTAYILAFHGGVPNIGTAPAIQRRAIDVLKSFSTTRAGAPFSIIDLGSGDGSFTRLIARNIPQARVTGLEMSYQSYQWSRLQKKLRRISNLDYTRGDMFAHDLSTVDVVVMYQSLFWMERLGKKLHAELKPGTLVICNRFQLGDGWKPVEHLQVQTLYPHQKDLYIYNKV